MELYQFLQGQENLVGALGGAAIGIAGVYLTVQSARRDIITQISANKSNREEDRKTAEHAILEWYFGRVLELRSYLVRETGTLNELFDVWSEAPRTDRYAYMLESIKYQDFAFQSGGSRPVLLTEQSLNEFSLIEDSEIRGRISYLSILINRTYEELAQNFYKLERFLELHIDGNDRIQDIDDSVRFGIAVRAYVISVLLDEAYLLLERIPWTNPFIENWQKEQEANTFRLLCKMNDEVEMPDRCKPKVDDQLHEEDATKIDLVGRFLPRKPQKPVLKKTSSGAKAPNARDSEKRINVALKSLADKLTHSVRSPQ